MNRKQAKELLPLIQAFAEGKKIEYSTNGENWSETEKPIWDDYFVYRVKPEPKFDHKTLQPFDKVLVRNRTEFKWSCSLFSHTDNELKYHNVCYGFSWKYCIPYNEDTMHLVGTTEEPPEYYRYWEE